MTDESVTIADLRKLVREFVSARNWSRYHTPKNLSMAMSIESAELMEHFQWWTEEEVRARLDDPAMRIQVGEEIADVCSYLLSLVNALDFDLSAILIDKMEKNGRKYPAAENQGDYKKPS